MDITKEVPVYVKIDDYKDILEIVGLIKNKISETRSALQKLVELKAQEEQELEHWRQELDEIQRKVEYIDKALFEKEAY